MTDHLLAKAGAAGIEAGNLGDEFLVPSEAACIANARAVLAALGIEITAMEWRVVGRGHNKHTSEPLSKFRADERAAHWVKTGLVPCGATTLQKRPRINVTWQDAEGNGGNE